MQWEGREESTNVEDRRGLGRSGLAIGGVGGVVVLLLALFFGIDPREVVGPAQDNGQQVRQVDPAEEKMAAFSKVVFHDTEVVWEKLFRARGETYQKPTLVLFSGSVASACGSADAAVGPFYCPGDARIYIDLTFYKDMERKLGARGEFARAYVIAHEVGHHVQRQLGYAERVDQARRGGSKVEINRMSVRMELQADYLAGVWAHHGQKQFKFLEQGDLESALNAAYQIGDDRLRRRAGGQVVPDSFTHGTSQQRMRWFRAGFDTGDVSRARQLFDLAYNDL